MFLMLKKEWLKLVKTYSIIKNNKDRTFKNINVNLGFGVLLVLSVIGPLKSSFVIELFIFSKKSISFMQTYIYIYDRISVVV